MPVEKIKISDSGFTIVEFVLISVVVVVSVIFLVSCTSRIRQAFENEARNNLKIIQTALERYGTDHNGIYPQYILGGDKAGWDIREGCETIVTRPDYAINIRQTNLKGGGPRPPLDPLLDGGYLDNYPQNPFMRNFESKAPEFSGGATGMPGTGDVRFGYSGTIVGNVLDDPRFLWGRYPVFDQPDKIRLQPTRLVNTSSQAAWLREFSIIHPKNEINPFYSLGGIPDLKNPSRTIHRWWPGQFFYRASGEMKIREDLDPDILESDQTLTIWDFDVVKFNRYILGTYADTSQSQIDLIRLTTTEGKTINNQSGVIQDKYSRCHAMPVNWRVSMYMSPPEIFGGGCKNEAPVFPYLDEAGNFIYGAPDGYPDGILRPIYIDGSRIIQE